MNPRRDERSDVCVILFRKTTATGIYTLSLHDALPSSLLPLGRGQDREASLRPGGHRRVHLSAPAALWMWCGASGGPRTPGRQGPG